MLINGIVSCIRDQLIKWFVDLQLSEYKVVFHESEEVGMAFSFCSYYC